MTKIVAYVLGAVTAVMGILGFVMAPVLGIFDANMMLSLAWLVTGLVLLAAAFWWPRAAGIVLLIFGVIYAVIAVLGLVMSSDVLGLFTNTTADNWLHVLLAVVMLLAGFMGRESSMPAEVPMSTG